MLPEKRSGMIHHNLHATSHLIAVTGAWTSAARYPRDVVRTSVDADDRIIEKFLTFFAEVIVLMSILTVGRYQTIQEIDPALHEFPIRLRHFIDKEYLCRGRGK